MSKCGATREVKEMEMAPMMLTCELPAGHNGPHAVWHEGPAWGSPGGFWWHF